MRICLPPTSNVVAGPVEQRVDVGHGPQQLVEYARRDEAQRIRRTDRIVSEIIGHARRLPRASTVAVKRLVVSNTLVVIKPSGFVARIMFHDASYE